MISESSARKLLRAFMTLFFVAVAGFVAILGGFAMESTLIPRVAVIITGGAILLGMVLLGFGFVVSLRGSFRDGRRGLMRLKQEVHSGRLLIALLGVALGGLMLALSGRALESSLVQKVGFYVTATSIVSFIGILAVAVAFNLKRTFVGGYKSLDRLKRQVESALRRDQK